MDSPLLCTSFSHFASQLVPARNGKCFRWWLPNCKSQWNGGSNSIFKHLLRTRKCFLLKGHFHWWKQSGKEDAQVERRDVPGPLDIYWGQIYSPWCTKQRTHYYLPLTTEDRRKKKNTKKTNKSIYPNLPTAAGRRGSKQGSFTHRKRALTLIAMDYLSPNSANLTYSIRERSVCVDQVGTWPYTLLGKRSRALSASSHSLLLDNSYHDNPVVSKELRTERN